MLETKRTNDKLEKIFKEKSQQKAIKKEEPELKPNVNIPSWLQPARVLPYPYNFITAVKQKLNLALYGNEYYAKYNVSSQDNTVNYTTDCPSASEQNISSNTIYESEPIQHESLQSIVPELKLDLRGIHSGSTSFTSNPDDSMSKGQSKQDPPSVSKKDLEASTTRTGDSTGRDIESAILSTSENRNQQKLSGKKMKIYTRKL